jgi:glucose-6-phosphate dehydrogenase assembly protein OpcA
VEIAMTILQIVDPSKIEPELIRIWEALAKEKKTRASLFNLVVFNCLSPRTDYIRSIVRIIVEKFPCRTLFITSDPTSAHPYLKTAVSVCIPQAKESSFACDQIDIGVAGPNLERAAELVLPHLLPDLPIYLLWAEDPSSPPPHFAPLANLATRIIFDSESADNLLAFSKSILRLKSERGADVADLNWARTEGWRDLIASLFDAKERRKSLAQIKKLRIIYNARETEFFCHLKIQAMYLLGWLSSRLKWKFTQAKKDLLFRFEGKEAKIDAEKWEKIGSGTILGVEIETEDGLKIEAKRLPEQYHRVKIQISTLDKCDLPYQFLLGQTATGQSLVKEICTNGTSAHYLDMLEELNQLDKDRLC